MKYQIEDYQAVGKRLKERLKLETEIVAIKYLKKRSEIPDGFIRPTKDNGEKVTNCRAIAAARREGKKIALTADDMPCMSIVGFGWGTAPVYTILKSQVTNKWNPNLWSVIRLNNKRYRLGGLRALWPFSMFSPYRGMMVSPLSSTPFVPDVASFWGLPVQMAHIALSFSYEGKYVPRGVACGLGDGCFSAGYVPLWSKNPVFAFGGFGDRAYAGAKDYECTIGMPAKLVFYVDKFLFVSGGDHGLAPMLKNPPVKVDEDILPGWRDVRNKLKVKKMQ